MKKIVFILAMTLMILGCKSKPAEVPKIPVKVAEAGIGEIAETVEYAGTVKAEEEAIVYPRASGKVSKKVLEEGAAVKKNQPILYFERDEIGYKFKPAPVTSPIDGVVGRIYVDIGESVSPQTPAAFVFNPKDMRIGVSVDEKYLGIVKAGGRAKVSVDARGGGAFAGSVVRVGAVVDPATRTFPAEVSVEDADSRIVSGMFARVRLVLGSVADAVIVPKDAVIHSDSLRYVFVVEDGLARRRDVETGILEGARLEITKGLGSGEKVVVLGAERLSDGVPVYIGE